MVVRNSKEKAAGKRELLVVIGVLFALVTVCIALQYLPFAFEHKSLIRLYDGTEQHYAFFVYLGVWLRDAFQGWLESGQWQLPMWNMSMGYGTDSLYILAGTIGDPLNWISVFVPAGKYSEIAFNVTVLLRIYLAAFAFFYWCRTRRFSYQASVIAALAYATSGCMVILPIQSGLMAPMTYFPLIVAGAEKVLNGRSPVLYVVATGLLFLDYFYLGYMALLALVPYCVVYCLVALREGAPSVRALRFLKMFAKFVVLSMLAMALAAVTLVPVVSVLLSADRLAIARTLDPLYGIGYYIEALKGFSSVAAVGADCYFGLGVFPLACLVLMLLVRTSGEERALKWQVVVLTVFLLVPFFGKMMNGFSYVTNRWVWAYSFFACALVPYALERFGYLPKRKLVQFTGVMALYCAFMAYYLVSTGAKTVSLYVIGAIVLLVALLWLARGAAPSDRAMPSDDAVARAAHARAIAHTRGGSASRVSMPSYARVAARALPIVAVALIVGSACVANYSLFAPDSPYMADEQEFGEGLNLLTVQDPSQDILDVVGEQAQQNPDWRFDVTHWGLFNAALLQKVQSFDHYIVIYNNAVDRFQGGLGIANDYCNSAYFNLDMRSALEHVLATRYVVTASGERDRMPYGYEPIAHRADGSAFESERGNVVGETLGYRPIASLYSHAIGKSEYEALPMLEKQSALVSNVVLEDAAATGLSRVDADDVSELAYSVRSAEGFDFERDGDQVTIDVPEPGASVELAFELPEDAECYVSFGNLSYEGASPSYSFQFSQGDDAAEGVMQCLVPSHHMYAGRDSWLKNIGAYKAGDNSVIVSFNNAGTYTVDELKVCAQGYAALEESMGRAQEGAYDVGYRYEPDRITCDLASADIEGDAVVLVTTPYSSGWSATIDGKPAAIEVGDEAFMAVRVSPGERELVLEYRTPLLFEGACISLAALLVTAALGIGYRVRHGSRAGRS